MPGRFAINERYDELSEMCAAELDDGLPTLPSFNICPTHDVPVIASDQGNRRIRRMRWGFLPAWANSQTERAPLINARSDTIAEKPAFRDAVRQRRCLVPATGYFEWTTDNDGKKTPWFVRSAEGNVLMFAGIWQDWKELTTLALITCELNTVVGRLHHRMPVLIGPGDFALWLGEAGHGAAKLMRTAPDDALIVHLVGYEVNSNRAVGPDLIRLLVL